MKKEVNITGYIDVEEKKAELDKHGLSVPYSMMAITALIQLLYNCLDDGDKEKGKSLMKDISEDPTKELEAQMDAVRTMTLLEGLRRLKEVIDKENLN